MVAPENPNVKDMTLRDWFAGLMLQHHGEVDWTVTEQEQARKAYKMADAMLKARG